MIKLQKTITETYRKRKNPNSNRQYRESDN